MHNNRLSEESSPYLQQHAHNPVNWLPWGEEAFAQAKAENKPVFLSVGYSSCHWCHVMAHESFEDEGVAELLNDHFISIKVDREERPAVDALYMQVTQLLTGRGGWPNSVFLLPDQRPFYAGTYWPREDRGGYAGFMTLLRQLGGLWVQKPDEIHEQAVQLTERLEMLAKVDAPVAASAEAPEARVLEELRNSVDLVHGGFGGAPKFPPHASLLTLLQLPADAERDTWVRRTLDAMSLGGIRDQVGGAFHRYATDAEWFLPHFEVMLSDNAQLAETYALASERFPQAGYAKVCEGICDAMTRDFRLPDDGFATAWDADSEGGEGDYYMWRFSELQELLGEKAEAFAGFFGAVPGGNAHDEATGRPLGKNILNPQRFPLPEMESELKILLEHRLANRTPPFRDEKVVTGWNGLMIRGLAVAGRVLKQERYLKIAQEVAEVIWEKNIVPGLRCRCGGIDGPPAVLEDYTFFAYGVLALDTEQARGWALEVMQRVEETFADGQGGYFLADPQVEPLLVNQRDPYDNALPSGVGMAVQVWRALGDHEKVERLTRAFQYAVNHSAYGTQTLWRR
jgi:uncharacterized protein YyaL (SSP411 family)